MRRSASTLQYHITREILRKHGGGIDLGFVKIQEIGADIERLGEDAFVVFKVHGVPPAAHCQRLLGMLASSKLACVHIWRDPRDVVASMKQRFGGSWKDMPNAISSTANEFEFWRSQPWLYSSRYDDVVHHVADIAVETSRIADFLGLNLYSDDCFEIAKNLTIEKQRERMPKEGWDRRTALWYNHIGSGKTGIWEDELTQLDLKLVWEIMGDAIDEYNKPS